MHLRRMLGLLGWFVCFMLLFALTRSVSAEVPLEVFGHLPSIENVAISPDGKHIAFTKTKDNTRFVLIVSMSTLQVVNSLDISNVKMREIIWADNNRILFITSSYDLPEELIGLKHEFFMLKSFDIRTGKSVNPIHATSSFPVMNVISGDPMLRRVDGQTVVYVAGIYIIDRTFPALLKLNLDTGSAEMVNQGTEDSRGWLVDENGIVVAAEIYDEEKHRWELRVRKKDRLSEAASGEALIEYPTITGFAPSDDILWVNTLENSDQVWKPLSLETGALGESLPQLNLYEKLWIDPYTNRVVGGQSDSGFVFFGEERQAKWKEVQTLFQGERIDFVCASQDYQKLVVLVEGSKHGYAYYMVDVVTHGLILIGPIYNGLSTIAEVRSIQYSAGDGMSIPAYLTLPPGREPKNLPLIILPHGGPAVKDSGRFDWWAQALAAQGYAVLQPNYRGSALGWNFISAGFGEWGRKMQTDLSDGVKYLVKNGTVDPSRVSIVGGSYGGYAALEGAVSDPGVYRCAVSVAGVSDLRKLYKTIRLNTGKKENSESRYLDRFLGASGPDDPILDTLSPLVHAARIDIPVLLIHGQDDTVVPFEQSESMAKALKRTKKSVELVKLKKEDHWLSRSETRMQMLESVMNFLNTYNPAY
jgi:dipeptidyl aminopeptidase/acylaminoacyl peptidase